MYCESFFGSLAAPLDANSFIYFSSKVSGDLVFLFYFTLHQHIPLVQGYNLLVSNFNALVPIITDAKEQGSLKSQHGLKQLKGTVLKMSLERKQFK